MQTRQEIKNITTVISPSSDNDRLSIAFAPIYKYELPPGHRFPMEKYELIPQQLVYEGSISEDQFFHPKMMTTHELLSTHTPTYLQKLEHLSLSRKEERAIGFPVRHDLVFRGKHIAHGTLECALRAKESGISMNVAGGTHHAFAGRGEGFCVFNDIALASNLLLQMGLSHKILIIDLDVHQGNGTASIFLKEPRVFTFSMHGDKNYPLRKEKSDLDIGLPDGIRDADYLKALNNTLPRLMDEVQPDLCFYLSGVDILETDKLGRLAVSREGCMARDRFVFDTCKKNGVPVAVSMGGGYSHRVADIIEAHCNTFRMALSTFF